MHPAPAVPAPPRRGWSRGPSWARSYARWLRRLTAGATTVAVVLVAAPGVVTSGAAPGGAGGRAGEPAPAAGAGAGEAAANVDLRLVGHKKPQPNRTIKRYRVRPGDTPSGIAVRYHAWTAQLLRINHTGTLYAGDVILVPVVTRAAQECTKHRHHRTNVGKYKVRAEKSAKAGAKSKAKVKPKPKKAKPKKASKPAKKKHAKPVKNKSGKKTGSKKASKPEKSRAPHHVRHAKGWHHRGLSRTDVRRAIVKKAKRYGVNPALALAVSWQESGWQHGRVSPAGAIGAMQIMPGTGQWMSTLVGRRLNTKDLYDNVTAGVVLLRWLRDEAGPRVAVAGYYQGLAGVRRHGMYSSTKRYVGNVHALRKRIERGWSPV